MAWVSPKVYAILCGSEEGKDIIEQLPDMSDEERDNALDQFFGEGGNGSSSKGDYDKAKEEDDEYKKSFQGVSENIYDIVDDYTDGKYEDYSAEEIADWVNETYFDGELLKDEDEYKEILKGVQDKLNTNDDDLKGLDEELQDEEEENEGNDTSTAEGRALNFYNDVFNDFNVGGSSVSIEHRDGYEKIYIYDKNGRLNWDDTMKELSALADKHNVMIMKTGEERGWRDGPSPIKSTHTVYIDTVDEDYEDDEGDDYENFEYFGWTGEDAHNALKDDIDYALGNQVEYDENSPDVTQIVRDLKSQHHIGASHRDLSRIDENTIAEIVEELVYGN